MYWKVTPPLGECNRSRQREPVADGCLPRWTLLVYTESVRDEINDQGDRARNAQLLRFLSRCLLSDCLPYNEGNEEWIAGSLCACAVPRAPFAMICPRELYYIAVLNWNGSLAFSFGWSPRRPFDHEKKTFRLARDVGLFFGLLWWRAHLLRDWARGA